MYEFVSFLVTPLIASIEHYSQRYIEWSYGDVFPIGGIDLYETYHRFSKPSEFGPKVRPSYKTSGNRRHYRTRLLTWRPAVQCMPVCMATSLEDKQGTDRRERSVPKSPIEASFDTDSFPIRIDNCCSRSISPHIEDFVPSTILKVNHMVIKGVSKSKLIVVHSGTLKWNIVDDLGVVHTILIPNSYHVPGAACRLLSPQHWSQQVKDPYGTWCATFGDEIIIQWNRRKHTKTVKIYPQNNNVATIWSAPSYNKYSKHEKSTKWVHENPVCYTTEVVTDDEMQDEPDDDSADFEYNERSDAPPPVALRPDGLVTDFQLDGMRPIVVPDGKLPRMDSLERNMDNTAKMLKWHHRLGHIPMKRIQLMAERGQLPKALATCRVPMCQACIYGKLTRRKWRSRSPLNQRVSLRTIQFPGQCVSVDQLESTLPGFIGQMKGKLTIARYRVATVFVDHFSDFTYVHLQQSTSAQDTLASKVAFEQLSSTYGVSITRYHADNGRFAESVWKDHVLLKNQYLTFCGVGAHHQNGKAEKKIRDVQDLARTAILHANRRWPAAVTANLWPYALRKASDSLNKSPRPLTKVSPVEMFSGVSVMPNCNHEHPFGCPAYALDGHLQNKQKIDKWMSRARMAIYLGPSPQHSQSVGLLLSLQTGLVSPQFHIQYDDLFETIIDAPSNTLPSSNWQVLAGFVTPTGKVSHSEVDKATKILLKSEGASSSEGATVTESSLVPKSELVEQAPVIKRQPWSLKRAKHNKESIDRPSDVESPDEYGDDERVASSNTNKTTRAGRISRPPRRYEGDVAFEALCAVFPDIDESYYYCPIAFAASSDPDVLTYAQAMKEPDRVEFVKAMHKEVDAHDEDHNWELILLSAVPTGHKVIPSVWAMRRKRRIDTQEIYKWKARINFHGGRQTKGVNYWETYAPVATWSSIRLIMNLAARHGWQTRQLDFVLAFPQAPVQTDLYMQLPQGYSENGSRDTHCLKLINNLYGQKQAGRVWYQFLCKGLCDGLGFTQSVHDPCIFWRGSVILIVYTDDTIVTGRDPVAIDLAITDIASKFKITSEPAVSDFLGVKIIRNFDNGSYTLTQPHLIQSILSDLNLQENSNSNDTPHLSSRILHASLDEPVHDDAQFHYRSIIGKLNYLEKCSRPDIAYAVHQCARFAHDPRKSHTAAVKYLGRYLKGTASMGINCTPDDSQSYHCYADADFAGQWNQMTAEHDRTTARSRSGYVILHNNCPIIWASKLQTEIAFSVTESEYVSLSQCLRAVIPMMELSKELTTAGFDLGCPIPKVHCTAFEDNSGALEMATNPKMRPRTKHINVKYHHFREAYERGDITIHKVSTENQWADIFTKPLALMLFQRFRLAIMGW